MICRSDHTRKIREMMTERKIAEGIELAQRIMRRTCRTDKVSYNAARRLMLSLTTEMRKHNKQKQ